MNHLIKWLIHHFLFGGTMFFAAGAVADVSSPITDAVVGSETPETPVETPDTPEVETPDIPETPDLQTQPEKVDNRLIPPDLREILTALKAKNPKLEKEITSAFLGRKAFRDEFPGGLQEAKQLKATLAELGGERGIEGLKEVHADAQELRTLDGLLEKGDPASIEAIASTFPEGFAQVMPKAIEKFAELNSAAYDYHMAGILSATLQSGQVFNNLYLAKQNLALKNYDEVARLLGEVEKFGQGIEKLSKTPPAKPADDPNKASLEAKEAELAQEKQKLFNQSVGVVVESFTKNGIEKELSTYLKGKTLNSEDQEDFNGQAVREIVKLMDADKDFGAKSKRYQDARDKDGLIKHSKEKVGSILAQAVKTAYGKMFKGASLGAQKPKPPVNGTQTPAAHTQGWVKISARPKDTEVDRSRGGTTIEMLMKNSAILKDGRRVQW